MLVLDATALEALFHGYRPLSALWHRADEGLVELGFPALAIVEAGTELEAPASAWDSVLWPPAISVLPLTERAAVEISAWSGTLAARHALWEARHMNCPLVTRQPELYAPGQVDIQVV
ncbi:hypothetical protein [Dactylosporangium sp. NPDC051484]|uniref:hypothetical protein n=1 Tax=Dactylosporangium sp. NPDC051484 TaxID=3154942 RepID=UPI0034501390